MPKKEVGQEQSLAIKKESQEVAKQNEEALAKLREMSGENNTPSFMPYIPMIEIRNTQEKKEVNGKMATFLCDPAFMITEKTEERDENGKTIFKKVLYAPEFEGVVIKYRYLVEKKYDPKSNTAYFRSYEFDNFTDSSVEFKGYSANWKQFKEDFNGKYTLYSIVYILVNNKDLVRLKVKGNSRSAVWDYMKTFTDGDSSSGFITKFSLETDNTGEISYHFLKLERLRAVDNLSLILNVSGQLNMALRQMQIKKENIEVLPKEESEVDVKGMPFN